MFDCLGPQSDTCYHPRPVPSTQGFLRAALENHEFQAVSMATKVWTSVSEDNENITNGPSNHDNSNFCDFCDTSHKKPLPPNHK